ncbi:hypothetical protein HW115_19215 [Verrucomicrobiaceae bacterium N1E253]|uniref:Uncharacterized protein n=2 Tax=Oceaniferula marina TaxID=2748318 RepID=A0A851GRV1_9BACT|nr:hypothetical protein [Oceaniferula marina]
MPLPIFIPLAIGVGWIINHYSGSLLFALVVGVVSIPVSVWIIDLVFNNPLALKFQNYPGNHSCPTCKQKYETYRSMPSGGDSLILECFKCGAKNRFDKKYHHLGFLDTEDKKVAEQVAAPDS